MEDFLKCFASSSSLKNSLEKENWSFSKLANSAFFFYLETRIEQRKKENVEIIIRYDWKLLGNLILNSIISEDVILFIKEINLINICNQQTVFLGFSDALLSVSNFEMRIFSIKGLENLLKFLKIDLVSIDSLINEAVQKKDLSQIAEFVKTFESRLLPELIFSRCLMNYKKFNSSEKIEKLLKDTWTLQKSQLWDLEKLELEGFEIFDMFESSEQVKSKSSQIELFSFYHLLIYEDWAKEIKNDGKGPNIKLFQLFERFLYSLDEKTVLLKELSVKNLKSLVEDFISSCDLEEFWSAFEK